MIDNGALINSAASEPESGSPSRGGRPATIAVPCHPDAPDSFVITGRKTYTTMAPALHFIMVSATIDAPGGPEAGQFLLERGLPGLRIEETWDSVGMRGSGSHDLVLDAVRVPETALLSRRPYARANGTVATEEASPGRPSGAPTEPSSPVALAAEGGRPSGAPPVGAGWAVLIPAVYLGLATAARNTAVDFARERRPQPLGGSPSASYPPCSVSWERSKWP